MERTSPVVAVLTALALVYSVIGCSDSGSTSGGQDAGVGAADVIEDAGPVQGEVSVMVFSKTAGFRHGSIEAAIEALKGVATKRQWKLTFTEDDAAFTADGLSTYQAVVFLMTTGDVLGEAAQKALESYVQGGGGWVGVHSASDTEADWPWYGELVGARFSKHTSAGTSGQVIVADRAHPATADLPLQWSRTEEWYEFASNPRGKVHVLATLKDGAMGHDHPHAWCHRYDGGRAFYTAGGHADDAWSDAAFVSHVAGGIDWAAGKALGDCSATVSGSYTLETITTDLDDQPMELEVAADGSVYYIHRYGAMKRWDPATKKTSIVADFSKGTALAAPENFPENIEDGLMGFALDPGFADNGHVWVFHSVKEPVENHLSRFTIKDGKLDFASKVTTLTIPVQRARCCHSAGNVQFGKDGLLYLSTGDNTDPFQSDGYSPIDEGQGRADFDAQRTSANTQDLRGKILRLKVKADGAYEVPEGNLFTDDKQGRPEIFVMGSRNPFRIAPDRKTGRLYWAETGPDAKADNSKRGPMGYDEVNFADTAGNYGWPQCIADNQPYVAFDFKAKTSGEAFSCDAPVNNSPNNTGAKSLPKARPAMIWYPYAASKAFPAIPEGKGRTAMAGVLYRSVTAPGANALPGYLDGKLIWMDWQRSWIYETTVSETGEAVKLNRFVPELKIQRPIDMDVGPDGSLYILEWGEKYVGPNADARISRLSYQPSP